MKTTLLLATACLLIGSSGFSFAEDSFPEVGKQYILGLTPTQHNPNPRLKVVIVKNGPNQWSLVEFDRVLPMPVPPPNQDSDADTPQPKPTPQVIREKKWLNFALILTAEEQKAEQGAAANP